MLFNIFVRFFFVISSYPSLFMIKSFWMILTISLFILAHHSKLAYIGAGSLNIQHSTKILMHILIIFGTKICSMYDNVNIEKFCELSVCWLACWVHYSNWMKFFFIQWKDWMRNIERVLIYFTFVANLQKKVKYWLQHSNNMTLWYKWKSRPKNERMKQPIIDMNI